MTLLLVAAVAAAALVVFLAFDRWAVGRKLKAYPSSLDLSLLLYQLLRRNYVSKFTVGDWRKLVSKDGFKLSDQLLLELALRPKSSHVSEICRVCDMGETGGNDKDLPMLYPSVMTTYYAARLLSRPEYPFPATGSVHVSQAVKVYKPMPIDAEYKVIAKIDPTLVPAKRGTLLNVISTLVGADGKPYCSSTQTFLVMHKQTREVTVEKKEEIDPQLKPKFTQSWELSPKLGWKYAEASGDINGIHRYKVIAKACGFPGVIMHGMYFLLRAAYECQRFLGDKVAYPMNMDVRFIRPVVIPCTVSFEIFDVAGDPTTLRYQVKGVKSNKVHLDGSFKVGAAQEMLSQYSDPRKVSSSACK